MTEARAETKEHFEARLGSMSKEAVLSELIENLNKEPLVITNNKKPVMTWSPVAEEFRNLSKEELIAFYSECQYPADAN